MTKLSLSIYVLFSIKINLFKVFVDLWLITAVSKGVRGGGVGSHLVLVSNLAVYKFIDG